MGGNPKWWNVFWNPWRGCTPCRRKCDACYNREPDSPFQRYGWDFGTLTRAARATFTRPLKLKPGTAVAVCLASDFFHEDADPWRSEAWDVMWDAWEKGVGPFIIPTSRPERIAQFVDDAADDVGNEVGGRNFWDSIWFLASIADQQDADEMVPELLKVAVGHLGVSHEPALGVVDFRSWLPKHGEQWACAGNGPCTPLRERCLGRGCRNYPLATGETSTGMRNEPHRCIKWLVCGGCNHNKYFHWHMPIWAARADRDQAAASGLKFMFKGHGEWIHEEEWQRNGRRPLAKDFYKSYVLLGRAGTGALLDGQRHDGVPWKR